MSDSDTASISAPAIPLHRLRVYNPSRLTDQEITLLFAVREELLQRILTDLGGEVPDSRPQHHLLVGQRGMGKTTLLLRIAAALRSSPLKDRFIPLSFAEEQYTIDRLSQFWLNCLDSLADSCDREGREDQARKIDRLVADITASQPSSTKDDTAAARAALKAFLDAAALIDRRPVLLVDNLQLIFERTADQQHELRAALTETHAPILVAAAPQLPPRISDYSFALYDHFKIHQLRALSLDDMRQLLLRLADRTGKPVIRQHVLAHPGRLQALHQLTGGNTRTTVLLFHLYAEDCSPSVADDLEKLLDDVTALYKARLEELSDQQQVIVCRLAEHWDPSDSRTLTENTRLEPGQISSQLDRLVKAGVVEEVPLFGTKRTGYQLAERFFNIWFLMRHASRRLKQPVRFLTKFLETLYEPAERERFARSWSNSTGLNSSSLLFSRALADSLSDSSLRGDLVRNTEFGSKAVAWLSDRLLRGQLCHLDSSDDWERTLAAATAEGEPAVRLTVDHLPGWIAGRINSEIRQKAATVLAGSQPQTAVDWYNTGWRLHVKLQRYAEAEAAYRRATELDPKDAWPWNGLGNLLQDHLQRYAEAEAAYRRAIELDPKCASPWNNLGNLLQDHLQRYAEAEAAYRRATELDPKFAWPWNNLGNLYCDQLGRYTDAADAFTRAQDAPESRLSASLNLVFLQRDFLGDIDTARQTFAAIEQESSPDCADTRELHHALFAAHDLNLGLAAGHLDKALDLVPGGLPANTIDDWARTAAVLLEPGHGGWLQQVLIRRGHNHSLRPFFEAIVAHTLGDRAALLNVAVEVRPAADWLYDQIDQRRLRLQDARRQRTGADPPPPTTPGRRKRKR